MMIFTQITCNVVIKIRVLSGDNRKRLASDVHMDDEQCRHSRPSRTTPSPDVLNNTSSPDADDSISASGETKLRKGSRYELCQHDIVRVLLQ